MEANDFTKHPPTFGSGVNSPLLERENKNTVYEMSTKRQATARTVPFKENDSVSNSNSFYGVTQYTGDKDLSSLKLISELIRSQDDWKDVPEIIRWTFKAFYDVLQNLVLNNGFSKKDVDRLLNTKASKSELTSYLATKANITDVSVTIAEFASLIETKAISDKTTYEDLQFVSEKKLDVEDFEEFIKKIDIENITTTLNSKANWTEVNEMISSKVDKETVTNALHKKVNKSDIAELQKEFDLKIKGAEDSFKSKVEQILKAQDQFMSLIESGEICKKHAINRHNPQLEDIRKKLDMKIDRREMDTFNQECSININKMKDDLQDVIHKLSSSIEVYKSNNENDLERVKDLFLKQNKKTFDSIENKLQSLEQESKQSYESLKKENKRQYDILRENMDDCTSRVDSMIKERNVERSIIDRLVTLEVNSKTLKEDFKKLKDKLRIKDTYTSDEDSLRSVGFGTVEFNEQTKYFKTMIDKLKKEILSDIYTIQNDIDCLKSSKLNALEYYEFKNCVQASMTKFEYIPSIPGTIKSVEEQCLKEINSIRGQINLDFENLEYKLMNKIDIKDFKFQLLELINEKADKLELEKIKINKLDKGIFEEFKEVVANDDRIESLFDHLELKSNIDDVNKALKEIHHELDEKANLINTETSIKSLEDINATLCVENCIGRWYWKSGNLKNDNSIPWEEQTINTCPENFLWEENKTSILTVTPGLYEIKCSLFSRKHKPNYEIMINGMSCISFVKEYNYDHQESNREIASSIYSKSYESIDEVKSQIVGNSITAFINLPMNSRVYINYNGEFHAEGFMSLRKI